MDAAVLTTIGAPPQFIDFPDPVAGDGQVVIEVSAAGVNHVDLAKASGRFYTGPPPVPSVIGSDGVGRLPDGRRVYFDEPVQPYGSWASKALVSPDAVLDIAEGLDDATAAALGNAGLAAWLGLSWRAELQPGETVLVLGATGTVGRIAVQAAKLLGAGRVVAADRNQTRLQNLPGADATVVLGGQADMAAELRDATKGGPHVIIDPLWGDPGLAAIRSARRGARHVQLGQLAGTQINLAAADVRSAALNLLGFAVFHAPLPVRRQGYLTLTGHAAAGDLTLRLERLPLRDVGVCWQRQHNGPGTKLVLIP